MRRLYFLIPDVSTVRDIVNELLLARIEAKRIHVVARRDMALQQDIPQATILQMSDVVPAVGRGVVYGGIAGLIAGVVLVLLFDLSFKETGGLLTLAVTLGGAGFGAWMSGMVGLSVPSSRLTQFQAAIDQGSLLMLVDVPALRIADIKEKVGKHYPAARFGGVEPDIPAFP